MIDCFWLTVLDEQRICPKQTVKELLARRVLEKEAHTSENIPPRPSKGALDRFEMRIGINGLAQAAARMLKRRGTSTKSCLMSKSRSSGNVQ